MFRRVRRTIDDWRSRHTFPREQLFKAERCDLNLGAEDGDATLRDVKGGIDTETPSVAAFGGVLPVASVVVGGNTIFTFFDGSTMTLVGVSDPTKISFLSQIDPMWLR
jgi:hypothetical protein